MGPLPVHVPQKSPTMPPPPCHPSFASFSFPQVRNTIVDDSFCAFRYFYIDRGLAVCIIRACSGMEYGAPVGCKRSLQ